MFKYQRVPTLLARWDDEIPNCFWTLKRKSCSKAPTSLILNQTFGPFSPALQPSLQELVYTGRWFSCCLGDQKPAEKTTAEQVTSAEPENICNVGRMEYVCYIYICILHTSLKSSTIWCLFRAMVSGPVL